MTILDFELGALVAVLNQPASESTSPWAPSGAISIPAWLGSTVENKPLAYPDGAFDSPNYPGFLVSQDNSGAQAWCAVGSNISKSWSNRIFVPVGENGIVADAVTLSNKNLPAIDARTANGWPAPNPLNGADQTILVTGTTGIDLNPESESTFDPDAGLVTVNITIPKLTVVLPMYFVGYCKWYGIGHDDSWSVHQNTLTITLVLPDIAASMTFSVDESTRSLSYSKGSLVSSFAESDLDIELPGNPADSDVKFIAWFFSDNPITTAVSDALQFGIDKAGPYAAEKLTSMLSFPKE